MKKMTAKINRVLKAQSTARLVVMYEMNSEKLVDKSLTMEQYRDLATSQGWIMDELESRDPDAFQKWMELDVTSPRTFFN